MNNIFYKRSEKTKKHADCKIVHNNIKINKYLLNINKIWNFKINTF